MHNFVSDNKYFKPNTWVNSEGWVCLIVPYRQWWMAKMIKWDRNALLTGLRLFALNPPPPNSFIRCVMRWIELKVKHYLKSKSNNDDTYNIYTHRIFFFLFLKTFIILNGNVNVFFFTLKKTLPWNLLQII